MIEEGYKPSQNDTVNAPSFVIYYVAQPKGATMAMRYPDATTPKEGYSLQTLNEPLHTALVVPFLNQQPQPVQIVAHYCEMIEIRRANRWPVLQKAIELCKKNQATLLIAELGTLASNESFTQLILSANVPFHCCDQPFVDRNILEALHKHAQVQKKLHGELIRKGLQSTSAKSGNPNAAEVIGKVNKPKIDTAILFAFLLEPIVQNYKAKGYSQRQMVKYLNDEGFTAPEGGRWVLSQLQKVLERVKLNDLAQQVRKTFPELSQEKLTTTEMAEKLNTANIPALKRSGWNDIQVKKLLHRIEQIEDIATMNQLFIQLIPILRYIRHHNMPISTLLERCAHVGIAVNNQSLVADMAV
ncbi:MAG: hypothetical protein RLZ35_896 [Pseudomonadota bacterium]|jgi:hypothetical protein